MKRKFYSFKIYIDERSIKRNKFYTTAMVFVNKSDVDGTLKEIIFSTKFVKMLKNILGVKR